MELVGIGHKTCNPNLFGYFGCVMARNAHQVQNMLQSKQSVASTWNRSSDFHLKVTGGYSINDPRECVALQRNLHHKAVKLCECVETLQLFSAQKFRKCKGPNYGRIMLDHRSNRSQFKQTLPGWDEGNVWKSWKKKRPRLGPTWRFMGTRCSKVWHTQSIYEFQGSVSTQDSDAGLYRQNIARFTRTLEV